MHDARTVALTTESATPAPPRHGRVRIGQVHADERDPKILLADEPTGALDSRSGMEIMLRFQSLGRTGITNIVVTHEPHVGQCAERMITMSDGRIVSDVAQRPIVAVAA